MTGEKAIRHFERYINDDCYTIEHQDACRMAISALREQKERRWIPVTERLPERTLPPKDVLVYHDLGCGMFVDRAWYSYDKKRWCSFLGMKLKVTHWMPLPEPPTEAINQDHNQGKENDRGIH